MLNFWRNVRKSFAINGLNQKRPERILVLNTLYWIGQDTTGRNGDSNAVQHKLTKFSPNKKAEISKDFGLLLD